VSSATTPGCCAPPSATTPSSPGPCWPTPPRSPCWATPGGRPSGSSPAQRPPHELRRAGHRTDGPYVTAALNGDVDNFADLKVSDGLRIAAEITSDAKVIPTLVSRRQVAGDQPVEAFRQTVRRFDGSVAIAANASAAPDRLQLALRGSGQALYVGLDDDLYVVASEPYGVVEDATRYLRLDGETPADPDDPAGTRGQVVELDAALAGTVEGITRYAYDGTPLPVRGPELSTPEVTTRDIDRGAYQHFLLKEIEEAPGSFRKTLRGKIATGADGLLRVALGPDTLPDAVRRDLAVGTIDPGAGDRPGHRGGGRPEPGPHPRRRARRHAGAGGGAARHRAVRLLAAPATCPTRSSSPSASPAPPPTPTARSTSCGPAAHG
jgi:hypothetical protein